MDKQFCPIFNIGGNFLNYILHIIPLICIKHENFGNSPLPTHMQKHRGLCLPAVLLPYWLFCPWLVCLPKSFPYLKYATPDSKIYWFCSPVILTATESPLRSECAILPSTLPSGLVIPSIA